MMSNIVVDRETTSFTLDLGDGASIKYIPHFIPNDICQALGEKLINDIEWPGEKRPFMMYGRSVREGRFTKWIGEDTYHYSGITQPPSPWTQELRMLRDVVQDATGDVYSGVLLNLYKSGSDYLSMHADNERNLVPNSTVASLTIGAERPFVFTRNQYQPGNVNRVDFVPLCEGSLLLMEGTIHHHWKHGVPKDSTSLTPRLNLTFRKYMM